MVIGLFITLLAGSCIPFISFWASLAHLLSLALFLTLRSHGLLLTSLDFPDPITLSFILGAHGLAINSLLSLLALLRACCGPFSLFYITYCLWVCYFSLSGLLLGPFASLRPICLFHGHVIHYSYRLGLIVFLSTY